MVDIPNNKENIITPPKLAVFDGSKAVRVHMAYDTANVMDDKGDVYKMDNKTLLIMLNEFVFNVNQKRVHKWIDCPEYWKE